MIPASSRSNDRVAQQPVFIVSHLKQAKVSKEVHDYLTRKKIQQLKEAVLQFNKTIKRLLG